MTITPTLKSQLVEQLDWHWRTQLRPRLDGLTDDEYFWEPVPGSWNLRRNDVTTGEPRRAKGDFVIDWVVPQPEPAPVITIAWRLAHVIVGGFAARVAGHFGGPPADYLGWEYAGTAAQALAQLDEGYAAWRAGVTGLTEEQLAAPCGPAEGPWADVAMSGLVLHINREVIHHGAEVALLRDLYAHRS
jgi:hypothetical protein